MKYVVLLLPSGAPPLPRGKEKGNLEGSIKIISIQKYISNLVGQPVYVYIREGFTPILDQSIEDLYTCFQSNGSLTINYGIQEIWG